MVKSPNLNIQDALNTMPKTRFYGSKRKLLPWLESIFRKFEFKTALDGFGGTASVSVLLNSMGKAVTYNDAFLFNVVSAKALFSSFTSKDLLEISNDLSKIKPFKGHLSQTYSKIFFTAVENNWLDGCLKFIGSIDHPIKRNILYYALIQSCLKKRPYNLFHRANLNLRLGNVERTFGNLSSWNKHFSEHIINSLEELSLFQIGLKSSPNILAPNDVMNINSSYDLVYLDPPYVRNSNNTDDYNRRYHFLEYLVNYDNLEGAIFSDTSIKEFQSNSYVKEWNNRHKIRELLYSLVEKHKKSIVSLSYADDGVPSIHELKLFFKQHFKHFEIKYFNTKYALSQKQRKEILITGLP